MNHFLKKLRRKINGMAWTLTTTGVMLVFLAILVVFEGFYSQLVVGFMIIVLAIMFFYLADKFWWLKRELDQLFKIK